MRASGRLLLVVVLAAALASVDLALKSALPTEWWAFQHRSDVWAAGYASASPDVNAVLAHWNGSSWNTGQVAAAGYATSIRRIAGGTLVAVIGGDLWRRVSGTWTLWCRHPTGDFYTAETDPAGGRWISGSEGAIVHRAPP